MSFNLTTSGAIIRKAGANQQSSLSTSGAAISEWCDEAEAYVMAETRKDWIADLSSVDANKRAVLSDTVSSLAAMKMVMHDMTGYNSRREAELILDVLIDNFNRGIRTLKEEKVQDFL